MDRLRQQKCFEVELSSLPGEVSMLVTGLTAGSGPDCPRPGSVQVEVSNVEQLQRLLQACHREGIGVHSVATRQTGLEDLYLQAIGKQGPPLGGPAHVSLAAGELARLAGQDVKAGHGATGMRPLPVAVQGSPKGET
jgi:hypothetical protein